MRKGKIDRTSASSGALFNLRKDIGETTDVSKENPDTVQKLKKTMDDYMKDFKKNIRPREKLSLN